jgi:hypothetical protein
MKKNSLILITILSLFIFPVAAFADTISFTDPGNKTVNEGDLLSFTLTTTCNKAATFSYSPAITGASIGTVTKSGSTYTAPFTWTPTYAQAGVYTVTYTACSPGCSATESWTRTITVNNVNRAPVLAAIGNKSVNEGATLTFTISATDPDGNPITYSASNLPSGATFTPSTRTFSWTPGFNQAGSYSNVLFTVQDNGTPIKSASEAITITVGNVNRPPVLDPIGNKGVNENETLTFTIAATDPDSDTITYSASNLPTGATFTPSTRTFSWTPGYDKAGSYTNVLFTVQDNGTPQASDSESITITVNNVNRPPELNPIGNQTVNEGELLQFVVTAQPDPDGDTLSFSASNLPTGASFNPDTQTFSWTPEYNQAGSYTNIQFTVYENSTPSPLSDSEVISITVSNVNRPPVLDPIGSKTGNEGQLMLFVVTAGTDPDGDQLTFSASNLPTGAFFNPDNQTFSWTPGYNQSGNYTDILFTVTDNGIPPASASETITITVGNVNRPPVLDSIGSKTINEGELLQFVITAGTDPDGDAVTFSASNLPPGASFDPDTQTFTWTPEFYQQGNYPDVLFTVTDNGTPQESDSEAITITVGNVNRAPVLNLIGNKEGQESKLLQFVITGNDPDGDGVIYSATGLPAGASFDPDTQTFTWTPGNGQAGKHTVHFSVADDGIPSENDSEDIEISIAADTLINLSSFTAAPANKAVILTWTTESETDNAGFNLYRATSPDGNYKLINSSQIPAKGSPFQGASYTYTDTGVKNGKMYYYKLEDIDLHGTKTMHGPESATPRWIFGIFRK